jgi:NADPH:quinone reductase-like Zn-dependent oxidoreductase
LNEAVQVTELPRPTVGPQDVLIQVRAAGVNPIDWKIAEGQMKGGIPLTLPAILGSEVAGVVMEVGSAVSRFQKGDEVYARLDLLKGGGYAEYVAVDENIAAIKPKKVDFVTAGGVPLTGLTAWQVLFEHLKLQKGEKILIHAGSGGVGSFAIQFAKNIGAEVATTVGPDGVDLAKSLGADHVIDYKSQRFEDVIKDFDAVFDTIGGETQARSIQVLKRGGVLVSVLRATVDPRATEKAGIRLQGVFMHPDGQQLAEIARLIDSGRIRPIIDRSFPLEQAKEALLYSKSGRAKGKIVINVI